MTIALASCAGVDDLRNAADSMAHKENPFGNGAAFANATGSKVDDSSSESKAQNRVKICHLPQGNPADSQTIEIDESAVEAHLEHGDYLGECEPVSPDPGPTPGLDPAPSPTPNPSPDPTPEPSPSPDPYESLLWHQEAYVKPLTPSASGGFAGPQGNNNVAISGDTMVIGAATESGEFEGEGAVYIYVRSGRTWTEQARLKAPNAGENFFFGYSVAIDGDTLVVGSSYEDSAWHSVYNGADASSDTSAPNSGAAYIYVRTGTTWSQQAYLKASNATAFDYFGGSVSISGDTVVVGAYGENHNEGAAYVFKRAINMWAQTAYLKAPNPSSNDMFGTSVAISHNTIAVGAFGESSFAGAAYIFADGESSWQIESRLAADNASAGDCFGLSVAVSGDTFVAGAPYQNASGAAYVFARDSGSWNQQAYLKSGHPDAQDRYGWMVATSGDLVVVSSMYEDSSQTSVTNGSNSASDNSTSNSGAAYIYGMASGAWGQEAYLKPSRHQAGLAFGDNIAVSNDTVVVSSGGDCSAQSGVTNGDTSPSDYDLPDSGAAYVFKYK
jgi:hypothetical protein